MRRVRLAAIIAAVTCMSMAGQAGAVQGAKISSHIELAEAAADLQPGEWVWAPQIAADGPVTVLVDLTSQLATVYRNGVAIGISTVSTGKPGHETPTGVFQILQKDADHRSSTYNNAPMPYQERLTWDGVALHAGGLPGYPESHGCVHLPYACAKELFQITSMGGTVVVTGRAGDPVTHPAGGVLAPIDELGNAAQHHALSADEQWEWNHQVPDAGPLSIIVSTTDQRVVVMRSGQEVGRARAVIDGFMGAHVATLHVSADGAHHWMLIGVPGHEDEAGRELDAAALNRLRLPEGFRTMLNDRIGEGTTVLITSASVGAHNSGKQMTLMAAND